MPTATLTSATPPAHLHVMKALRSATSPDPDHDPRHTFLTAQEVIARYRWGRTKGYKQLRSDDFPCPVAGRYRLDLLMAWEDKQIADAAEALVHGPAGPPAKRHFERKASA